MPGNSLGNGTLLQIENQLSYLFQVKSVGEFMILLLSNFSFDESWQDGQDGPYQTVEFRWKILQGWTYCLINPVLPEPENPFFCAIFKIIATAYGIWN